MKKSLSLAVDSPGSPPWHAYTTEEALRALHGAADHGLTREEALRRLRRDGPNAIEEQARRPAWRMFLDQFRDFMIVVLVMAAVVAGFLGETADAVAIGVIVALNAVIGFGQEYRAQRAVAALRRMAAPSARVRRDGQVVRLPVDQVVVGDRVLLAAGDVVPADLRLLETAELQVDESTLTGESQAVRKDASETVAEDAVLGDRRNMAYKGTPVASGRGEGVVAATAMATELGRIAGMLSGEEAKTPLQRRLARFGRILAVAVLMVCAVIFAAGLLRGEPVLLMLLTAVSLAVAAIPEALPAVVTVALALGARRMVARHALIRRLPAVETLGSVTYICADKTGTLTENRMGVEVVQTLDESRAQLPAAESAAESWALLAQAMALNNDVRWDGEKALGDPTEVALWFAARRAGFSKDGLAGELPRIGELPFDAGRTRMTTLHQGDGQVLAFTKGAPETVLPLCRQVVGARGAEALDGEAWARHAESLAAQGYRVLALAYRRWPAPPPIVTAERLENDLRLLGLVALMDPPREGAAEAVAECRTAGVTPVMITGDHPATARHIAARLGIAAEDGEVISGRELARLDAAELARRVKDCRIYARVSPEQKTVIVNALQAQGAYVAMTGDGVNDAPSLTLADIGVAMGRKGTDVAREAADMVLLDDDFATIVAAVREGRRIYDNVRKFIKYTMTSNAGEIWTLLLAPFLGLPLPLLPIQILWVNLVTDGLPGLALAAEPAEPGVMKRPPRPPGETVFAHGLWQHMIWAGLAIGLLSLAAQAWAYHSGSDHWQTVVFTVLVFCQLVHALAIRSERESLFVAGVRDNPALLAAAVATVVLQLMIIYVPAFQPVFHTAPLTVQELTVCFVIPWSLLAAVETEKWLARRGVIYQQ